MSHFSLLKGAINPNLNSPRVGIIITQAQVTPLSLTSDSATTIATISNLSAGYWEIWGKVTIQSPAGSSVTQTSACAYSSASQSYGLDAGMCCQTFYGFNAGSIGNVNLSVQLPRQRITILNGAVSNIIIATKCTFTGAVTANGFVCVERVA
jgi:hypothetical protein